MGAGRARTEERRPGRVQAGGGVGAAQLHRSLPARHPGRGPERRSGPVAPRKQSPDGARAPARLRSRACRPRRPARVQGGGRGGGDPGPHRAQPRARRALERPGPGQRPAGRRSQGGGRCHRGGAGPGRQRRPRPPLAGRVVPPRERPHGRGRGARPQGTRRPPHPGRRDHGAGAHAHGSEKIRRGRGAVPRGLWPPAPKTRLS